MTVMRWRKWELAEECTRGAVEGGSDEDIVIVEDARSEEESDSEGASEGEEEEEGVEDDEDSKRGSISK